MNFMGSVDSIPWITTSTAAEGREVNIVIAPFFLINSC